MTATSVVALALAGPTVLGASAAAADTPGATTTGGSAPVGNAVQQNTSQNSRQNNHCSDPNALFDTPLTATGSRVEGRCTTGDGSFNHGAFVKSGGADAEGGSSGNVLVQQNTAQQGRQNTNCADSNLVPFRLTGSRSESRCADRDDSFNRNTRYEGGGADANGGSSAAGNAFQQNTAQEGRQNANCADPNETSFAVTQGRLDSFCGNKDDSFNEASAVKGGGARTDGGSAATSLVQQNTAQEGRQNANCTNANASTVLVTGGRLDGSCRHVDGSLNRKTFVKGKGAKADGGSSLASATEQNVAQEGRQNSNCANPNDTTLTVTGGRGEAHCTALDRSGSVGTAEFSGGAEAEGSSSAVDVYQQNVAQEGRQNLNCANSNGATVTLSGARNATRCVAVDDSKKLGWYPR
ncbi:hypothetical protein [Streptomyces sp. NPDC047108]|uniref:hypothetical protein n=1 Tax=Streptomyces sp. NPDC047108 TaxID=3155025 RepID=UPI0033DB31DD